MRLETLGGRWARALAVLLAVSALVLGSAAPAQAHATLTSTDPAEGALLPAAPEQVRFTFDASVTTAPDGAQVFDAVGDTVAATSTADGAELVVTLTEEVEPGTLVVVWRVVSGDGHPISGSLSFSIGAPSESVVRPAAAVAEVPAAPVLLSAVRWAGYAALLLAGGLVAFVVLLLPRSGVSDAALGRVVAVTRAAAAVTVLAWSAALPLVAAYQLGGGAASLARASTWQTLAPSEYGVTAAVLLGTAAAALLLGRGRVTGVRAAAAGAAALVAVCAPSATGHTRGASPQVLAVGADVLHLLAGSAWLGGLVALALVLPDLAARGTAGAEVLARFSTVAAGLLVALVVAGSVMAWQIVGSWTALVDTGYGQLLVLKVAVALVAVVLAGFNRYRLVPVLEGATRRRDRRAGAQRLARAVSVEGIVVVTVLLLTGLLVDRSPDAEASVAAQDEPGRATGRLGEVRIEVLASPLLVGSNTIALTMSQVGGQPFEGVEPPRLRLSSGQVDLGEVVADNVGPGAYTIEALLPAAGTWQLQVSVRTGEFENPVTTVELEVAAGPP